MKPREQRRKVFVPARARVEQRWIDVNVLDVSSRGFKLHASTAPPRGAYIELCRGSRSFVARVVWTAGQRFGVRTQDKVATDAFVDLSAPDPKPPAGSVDQDGDRRNDRRRREDNLARADRSREFARTMEYGWMMAFGGLCVVALLAMLQSAFTTPIARLASALN